MEKTLYFNYISTGCTCCSYENFCEGPFETLAAALESAKEHHRLRTLVSQFAPNGLQDTYEAPCRVIVDENSDEPFILIPGGYWIAGFSRTRLPADLLYADGFKLAELTVGVGGAE